MITFGNEASHHILDHTDRWSRPHNVDDLLDISLTRNPNCLQKFVQKLLVVPEFFFRFLWMDFPSFFRALVENTDNMMFSAFQARISTTTPLSEIPIVSMTSIFYRKDIHGLSNESTFVRRGWHSLQALESLRTEWFCRDASCSI